VVSRTAFVTGRGSLDLMRPSVPTPMPTTEPAGFTRIWAEDFVTPYPVGSFTAHDVNGIGTIDTNQPAYPTYGSKISIYPDGGLDTGHYAQYYATKTLSTQTNVPNANGVLDIYCHTENLAGTNTALSAWVRPLTPNDVSQRLTYGRFSCRMRADPMFGWGGVFLTIAQDWPAQGEDDWPENPFWKPPEGNYHYADAANVFTTIPTNTRYTFQDWHVYTQEWKPGRIRYLMDGVEYLNTTDRVGSGPRQHVYQCGGDGQVPPVWSSGHVQIDWWTVASWTG
jgi:hypothetical protein